jgi:hypothetical protein
MAFLMAAVLIAVPLAYVAWRDQRASNDDQRVIHSSGQVSESRIVRAEVEQEFANRVSVGQVAKIQDDGTGGGEWRGQVVRISDWFPQRRSVQMEPMQFNDVRTMEVVIRVEPGGKEPLLIGQRVRVILDGFN